MEVIELYETASTDGYKQHPDGKFFESKFKAVAYGKNKYGYHSTEPIAHFAISDGDGNYYLLQQKESIQLADSKAEMEKVKRAALSKLTIEERQVLGLTN